METTVDPRAVLLPQDLAGQSAIITGAARGIGLEIARHLVGRGANVCLVDVIDGNDAADELQKVSADSQVFSQIVDVRDRAQVRECIRQVHDRFGRLDIVVNNAGTCGRISLEEMDDETWERDIQTNLRGTFLFTQSAIYPYMKNQRSGRIINVSSISGIMGGPYATGDGAGRSGPAYAASKGGVIALTKWVAKEVGQLGITCNTVAPGPVATPMTERMEYPLDHQAIKRMGTPDDIAAAVGYLASPSASYVTGDVLKVCGGSAIG